MRFHRESIAGRSWYKQRAVRAAWFGASLVVAAALREPVNAESLVAPAPLVEWHDVSEPRGVVLLVHGLNNTPTAMRPLGELLQRQRLTTGIVELTGHGDGTMRPIGGFETWVEDVRAAARAAAERYPSTPLTVLGFSLGGAVALGALDDGMMPPVAKLVLIAPAVTLKGYTAPLRVISWFGVFGLAVPSVIPRTYRSSATTPLAYYAHLFRLIEHLLTKPHTAAWGRVSALVISSRGDEFVSHRRWDRYVRELGVRHWEHLILPPADTGLPGHLLLDEPSFGAENWNVVSARLIDFLTAP